MLKYNSRLCVSLRYFLYNLYPVLTPCYCVQAVRAWHAISDVQIANKSQGETYVLFFTVAEQSLVGQGLLIIECSRWHSRHTTLGRSPLYEWSVRRRDLYLTTQQRSQQASGRRPTPLDRATTGIGTHGPCPNSIIGTVVLLGCLSKHSMKSWYR